MNTSLHVFRIVPDFLSLIPLFLVACPSSLQNREYKDNHQGAKRDIKKVGRLLYPVVQFFQVSVLQAAGLGVLLPLWQKLTSHCAPQLPWQELPGWQVGGIGHQPWSTGEQRHYRVYPWEQAAMMLRSGERYLSN